MAESIVRRPAMLMVHAAGPDAATTDDLSALAAAFAEQGWTHRRLAVVESPRRAGTDTGDAGVVEVTAASDHPDLRGWPAERLEDPAGWQEALAPDDAGLWQQPWTDQIRAAVAEEIAVGRPDLLYVATSVWSVADAVRRVAADAGVPFVLEPGGVRPPGLRRGLGSVLGPMTAVEAEVVAAAAAVVLPAAAVPEWALQHPQATLVAIPLMAGEAPRPLLPADPVAGPVTVLGGIAGSAPLGELIDAWQLAGAPGGELLWWGAEPLDRSQRTLLDQAAPLGLRRLGAAVADRALSDASLVVALLGDRQGLPRGASTALAAGTPVLVVAEPSHPALLEAALLDGVVVTPAQADLIAQALAAPPSRQPADPAAVAAAVAASWRGVVDVLVAGGAG